MNHAIAKQWVAALRSGQYKQTKNTLRDGDSFCCLGILCNLHAIEHPEIARKEVDSNTYLGSNAVLPLEVSLWAEVNSSNGKILDGENLAYLNDSGCTFDNIAGVIENNVGKL